VATSGENYWPPTGRTSWPLTPPSQTALDAHKFVAELAMATSVAEVASKVDALVDGWLEVE
jgi:hypothetical protein